MAPDYQRPAAPVPTTYEQAPTADAETPAAATVNWRDYYTDPILQDLIDSALRNNRDLRTALLRVEEARALWHPARRPVPTIGVQADGSRARVPGDLNLTRQPQISSQYQVGVGMASWELDFWGRVRSLKDAALQNYLASDAAARAATLSLITQVADGYLTLRELDERLALTRATIASRAESLRIFKRRFEVGAISRLDLTQVETLWQQATALGADLEQSRCAGPRAGAAGGRPAGAASGRARLDDAAVMRDLPAGLPSDLLASRPDIVAAEHRLKPPTPTSAPPAPPSSVHHADRRLRHRQRRAGRPVRQRQPRWSFAPKLSLPIFDAGRRSAALDLAETRRDQAVAGYEKPSRALSATCPTRCRRATGWPSRWRCCAPPSPRRANAPGWPSCATTTAPRPTWKCWTRSATCWPRSRSWCRRGARCCPAVSACTRRWAAARARLP